jgi:hypothetical protein
VRELAEDDDAMILLRQGMERRTSQLDGTGQVRRPIRDGDLLERASRRRQIRRRGQGDTGRTPREHDGDRVSVACRSEELESTGVSALEARASARRRSSHAE